MNKKLKTFFSILGGVLAVGIIALIVYAYFTFSAKMKYKFAYKQQVIETIKEQVKQECLKK